MLPAGPLEICKSDASTESKLLKSSFRNGQPFAGSENQPLLGRPMEKPATRTERRSDLRPDTLMMHSPSIGPTCFSKMNLEVDEESIISREKSPKRQGASKELTS